MNPIEEFNARRELFNKIIKRLGIIEKFNLSEYDINNIFLALILKRQRDIDLGKKYLMELNVVSSISKEELCQGYTP